MKCCLVTGATGFIGKHVVDRLLTQGWNVIAVARGTNPFDTHSSLTYVRCDLTKSVELGRLFKRYSPTHLIHLAWEATPGKFWHSAENFKWVSASVSLLDHFIRQGGKKAVLAGSCAEYKWQNKILEEDFSPLAPKSRYSCSKALFKKLAERRATDIDLVWARVFFPYGPDEDDSKLISHIIKEISNGRAPSFQVETRAVDFIHIEDVATAFERLASCNIRGTVNICSGVARLPHEIALDCAKIAGQDALHSALASRTRPTAEISVVGSTQKLETVLSAKDLKPFTVGLHFYSNS